MIEIKHSLQSRILVDWEIPEEFSKELARYYLLHWKGAYFRSLYEHSPRFRHQDIYYQILFYRGDVLGILTAEKVAVSFRYRGLPFPYGYAMVKAI